MITRSYSELRRLDTIEERFEYLSLQAAVGAPTFGSERYINQRFYQSKQWRDIRHEVISRDNGCDLGIEGFEIHVRPTIHHMNPMAIQHIVEGDPSILDPEFLITCSDQTHRGIHYGDADLLPYVPVGRAPGDTKLW